MSHLITENSNCSIYHTRTFQKTRKGDPHECMLRNDDVHVLVIDLHPGDVPSRKRDRVRVQVRLWASHTPHFQIEKFEKISPHKMSHDHLVFEAGMYLTRFLKSIYENFNQ